MKGSIIGDFSTLKILQGSAFNNLRSYFKAGLKSLFLVPANTFDNVKGQFPIGFFIWDTSIDEAFKEIQADVYDSEGNFLTQKGFRTYSKNDYINAWISIYKSKENNYIGYLDGINGNDFQHNNIVYILNSKEQIANPRGLYIYNHNLIECSIYNSVRHVIPADWLNDRDQFLFPNDGWKTDYEFQTDCLIWTLFNNNIQSKFGVNHWIPFSELEVDARDTFASHFMTDFLSGKIATESPDGGLFASAQKPKKVKLKYSSEAKAVLKAGRELWRYYHASAAKSKYNVNASLYDIKEYFQGRNDKGKMNNSSADEKYNELIGNLRSALKDLAKQIEPKVYEYGFLRE